MTCLVMYDAPSDMRKATTAATSSGWPGRFIGTAVDTISGVAMLILYLPFIMDMLMYTRETQILVPVQKLLGG